MASIIRKGSGWRAFVYRAGRRESRMFSTRAEAADWAAMREAALIEGEATGSAHTLAAAMDRYERSAVPMMRSQRSELARLAILRRASFARLPLRELRAEHIAQWRDDRLSSTRHRIGTPITPGTVIREMTTLRSVLEYARKDLGWIAVNPSRDVKRPPEPPARKRIISDDERDALLSAWGYTGAVETVQHEAAVALLLALETGMRAGELLGLMPADVDLGARCVTLRETKNGDRREVPLSMRAVDLLRSMQGRRLRHVRASPAGFLLSSLPTLSIVQIENQPFAIMSLSAVTAASSRSSDSFMWSSPRTSVPGVPRCASGPRPRAPSSRPCARTSRAARPRTAASGPRRAGPASRAPRA